MPIEQSKRSRMRQRRGGAAAPSGRGTLAGVCPATVVVQTNWFPQSEHGAAYRLVGPGYRIDAAHKRVTGPLVAGGHDTGVRIEVRAGGPAVGFQSSAALMYQDPDITLGMLQTDEIVQFSKTQPVVGVMAPLELDPQILLWDPKAHPDWHTIADIGQSDVQVLYFQGSAYMEYLVGAGILRRAQIDGRYDGSPSRFVASGGKIAVQGYAPTSPTSTSTRSGPGAGRSRSSSSSTPATPITPTCCRCAPTRRPSWRRA